MKKLSKAAAEWVAEHAFEYRGKTVVVWSDDVHKAVARSLDRVYGQADKCGDNGAIWIVGIAPRSN